MFYVCSNKRGPRSNTYKIENVRNIIIYFFYLKKRFKVTIHFMDSYNHVFISHRILRKITAFIWKTFLIVIRKGIFIYLKHCFTSSSLLLDRVILDKTVKPVTTLTALVVLAQTFLCLQENTTSEAYFKYGWTNDVYKSDKVSI